MIDELSPERLRIAVDGMTASAKSTFGHELAVSISDMNRQVLRASLDDFKRPWAEARLYDKGSGEGYFRNAFDYKCVKRILLMPATPGGTGRVALCSIDPLTQSIANYLPARGSRTGHQCNGSDHNLMSSLTSFAVHSHQMFVRPFATRGVGMRMSYAGDIRHAPSCGRTNEKFLE